VCLQVAVKPAEIVAAGWLRVAAVVPNGMDFVALACVAALDDFPP
jgi:hypothetical protein